MRAPKLTCLKIRDRVTFQGSFDLGDIFLHPKDVEIDGAESTAGERRFGV